MKPVFYDKEGNPVSIGDKVVHDNHPGQPHEVLAFICRSGQAAMVDIADCRCNQLSTMLTKWKPVVRPRTWQEVARIVIGYNEFTDNGGNDILVGNMLRQHADGSLTLDGIPLRSWKWRHIGETEWRDLATVEE